MDQVMVRMKQNNTLISICLTSIIKHIQANKLNYSQLAQLPRNLNNSFLNMISKRGYLNDENIEILLKDYTKTLELSECESLTDRALDKISRCKNLIKLDLNSNSEPRVNITSEGVARLSCSCKSLQVLQLRKCVNVDDECIEQIALNCPGLRDLNLANCPLITDKSLVALSKSSKLKAINLSGTKITDEGVFQLFSSPDIYNNIEEIHISNCDQLTDESIECILLNSNKIKYLLFHGCPRLTAASRLILDEYMRQNEKKFKHITWTIY